ncbi:GntP family permease [uncultured Bifidobacterium sp.]|uniref:GntP family permease n=1 Tax=uncultured Bifidobacterium sp. TaxID=165187 RepID=UPI00258CD511|nr:SLC13 family permease [uncultured Bifidobacterium sp.]
MNLIAAAIIGIVVIVLLIAVCKVHPFLSLLAGSFTMAVCAGVEYDKAFDSFTSGVGGTISNVGLLIAFGSIIGTTLFRSGGADAIVDTIMTKTPLHRLPWAMALIAFIVGIPMFFEVGVVILIPVVLFVARRSKSPVVLLGIPALAGLSTLHAFVPPPPPGPLTAIGAGSVFFSHLNDAGFWLVREYFGMSVGQTLKTWSLMETILSVVGLGCVMLLSLAL